MKFLLYAPVIISIAVLVVIVIVLCSERSTSDASSTRIELPDGSKYADKMGTQKGDWPDLADQLDGRITNIFTNPKKGVL